MKNKKNRNIVNNKKDRTVEIIALVFALLSLAIGFITLSRQLKIQSDLTVHPDNLTFKVLFSSSSNSVKGTPIEPQLEKNGGELYASKAVISNLNQPMLKNIEVNFNKPGQKVKYKLYIYNAGEYMAYLNSIRYNNVAGLSTSKLCVAKNGKTNNSVKNACENIRVSVKVGNLTTSDTKYNIKDKSLRPRTAQEVEVTIEYLEGHKEPNQEFDVIFGDITLYYSMFPNQNETQDGSTEIS